MADCIVPMIATGNAMSTFTAQNLGAGKEERVKEGCKAALQIIICFGIVLIFFSQLFHALIVSIFVREAESPAAFSTGTAYFRFVGWFFEFLGFKAVTDGILRGSGDTTVYMIANLVNLAIRVSVASCALRSLEFRSSGMRYRWAGLQILQFHICSTGRGTGSGGI